MCFTVKGAITTNDGIQDWKTALAKAVNGLNKHPNLIVTEVVITSDEFEKIHSSR